MGSGYGDPIQSRYSVPQEAAKAGSSYPHVRCTNSLMKNRSERRTKMLYSLKKEQLEKLANSYILADFPNAEVLLAIFETNPDIVREVLPHPLEPSSDARGVAFVGRYPETHFAPPYNEGALLLNCEFKGERGTYCLSMPVDDDTSMIAAREYYGYPKKIADAITLESDGTTAVGSVIRKGTEILRIECQLDNDAPDDFLGSLSYPTEDWDGIKCQKVVFFSFKYFPSPGGKGFDYLPRLIREPVLLRPLGKLKTGNGQIKLSSTIYDPLGEIPVESMISIVYGRFHNTMLPGKVVGRVWNPLRFMKHAFFKTDMFPTIIESFDPNQVDKAKLIAQKAKKY
jgi:acetoacetate decarboxylase